MEGHCLHTFQRDFVVKMFLDYFNLKTHEHFENVGGKAVTRRSKSSVLAKAGQQSISLALCCLWGQ